MVYTGFFFIYWIKFALRAAIEFLTQGSNTSEL